MTKQVHSHIILCDMPLCKNEATWVITSSREENRLGYRYCEDCKRAIVNAEKHMNLYSDKKTVFKHEIRRFGSNDG